MKSGKKWAVYVLSLLVTFSLSGGLITASAGEGQPVGTGSETVSGTVPSGGDTSGTAVTSSQEKPDSVTTAEVADFPSQDTTNEETTGQLPGEVGSGIHSLMLYSYNSLYGVEHAKKGKITVIKYLDQNGDGIRQPDEPGMPDVLIKLVNKSQAYTDSQGVAVFSQLADGSYTVTEVVPAGYQPTTPTSFEIKIKFGSHVTVFFGNQPIPPVPGKIAGRKWEDLNADGIRQDGEPPVSGVKVELWKDGTLQASSLTGEDGSYSFTGLAPGPYTIKEIPGENWIPTQPAERQVVVSEGKEVVVDFLNARKPAANCDNGIVEVIVREDLNFDGVADMNEPLLDGVRVELYRKVNNVWVPADGYDGPYAKTTGSGVYGMLYIFGIVLPPYPAGWAGWAHLPRSDGPTGYTEYAVKVVPPEGYHATAGTWFPGLILRCPLPCWWQQVSVPLARCGTITGTKYEDVNGNGIIDPADRPVEGITIRLFRGTALIAETQTDAGGAYRFDGLKPGSYRVEEILPTGSNWYPVIPAGGSHELSLAYGEARSGIDFLNRRPCSLRGRKWEDRNYNGFADEGDLPVSGVTVELWRDGVKIAQTTTKEDGSYAFEDLIPGTYTVREVLESPWEPVSPASGTHEAHVLESGQAREDLDFLNARYGSIRGIKFHDADLDGIMDEDEVGIDGVTVIVEPGPISAETAGGGFFSFDRLKAGTYLVRVDEDSLPGYFPTGPTSVEVYLAHGEQLFLYFGNAPSGSISGRKWLDADMDGYWDPEEDVTLAGITIDLYAGNPPSGTPLATAVTGEGGSYSFTGLLTGVYTVVERPTPGMAPTTPTQVRVEVRSGIGTVVDFGNCPFGTVKGLKVLDLDGDGVVDEGEQGLGGVTITLQGITDPSLVMTAETAEDGSFAFAGLLPGQYLISEAVPSGYYATRPISLEVEVEPGATVSAIFTNAPYASVSGYKWQDNDGDGAHDPGEPPVGGITVVLTGYTLADERVEMQTVTADDGSYSFQLLEAGNYSIYEVMPYNMEATATDRYDLLLKPGDRIEDLDFFNALVEVGGEVVPPPTPGPGPVTPPSPPAQVAPELVRGKLPTTGAPLWIPPLVASLLILAGCLLLMAGARRV